jgi:hypothetical protein
VVCREVGSIPKELLLGLGRSGEVLIIINETI